MLWYSYYLQMQTELQSRDNDSDGFWEEWPGYTENYIRSIEFASLSDPGKVCYNI